MSAQLGLLPAEPKLTDQQRLVLDALTRAAADGLEPSEAGALAHSVMESRWRHGPEERCLYCAQRGNQLLRALRAKGLAKYSAKRKLWVSADVNAKAVPETKGMLPDSEPLPF